MVDAERNCRMCKHFIRVYEENFKDSIRKRGFCTYGLCKADFSLYVSSSYAKKCPFFKADKKARHIFNLENHLMRLWDKKRGRFWDRRTKIGKLIRKRYQRKYRGTPGGVISAEREVLGELYQEFIIKHISDMQYLKSACRMTFKEYEALVYSISRKIRSLVNGPDFTVFKIKEEVLARESKH